MKHLTNGYCTLIKDLDFYSLIFKEPVISISSAPFNGGLNLVKMYMNRQVPIDYNHDPVKEIANFLVERGFPREGSLVTITACDLENAFINEFFMDDFFLSAFDDCMFFQRTFNRRIWTEDAGYC